MNYNRAKNNDPAFLGQKFGRLTVVGFGERKLSNGANCITWNCKCDCGNMAYGKLPKYVKSGEVMSCGCLKREQNAHNLGEKRRTHVKTDTRLYRIWEGMRRRCRLATEKHSSLLTKTTIYGIISTATGIELESGSPTLEVGLA